RLAPGTPAAQRVDTLAQAVAPGDWQNFIIHEGSKGPLEVEITPKRLVMVGANLPGRDEWLVVRRPLGELDSKHWKFYRSNGPVDTPLQTLARLTASRWPVESVIEQCKDE